VLKGNHLFMKGKDEKMWLIYLVLTASTVTTGCSENKTPQNTDAGANDGTPCAFDCVSSLVCRIQQGELIPGAICPNAKEVCCDLGRVDSDSGGDGDADTDGDSDTEADTHISSGTDPIDTDTGTSLDTGAFPALGGSCSNVFFYSETEELSLTVGRGTDAVVFTT
jgi:hypothetical protein